MNRPNSASRGWAPLVYGTAILIALFFLLSQLAILGPFTFQAIGHGFAGWIFFLRRNLGQFTLDPAILFSGLIAGLAALVVLHLVITRIFRPPPWRLAHSLAVMAATVVLFFASFLVPGIAMLLRAPMAEGWTKRQSGGASLTDLRLHELYQYLHEGASEHRWFPDSLPPQSGKAYRIPSSMRASLMYPAAGMPFTDDPEVPLLILPLSEIDSYRVLFADSNVSTIPADQLDNLLDRSTKRFQSPYDR
ncbi:hypothetical protein [Haloferula sargassicola]|uniref:DUF1499 domain-containing protein n=1 Tax=Haloferula sargassicola TaxID=490096 RepID=A0ABP9UPH7_9BACT